MSELPQPGTFMDEMDKEERGVDKDGLFRVDTGLIPQALMDDQAAELQGLGLSVFNQEEFEQGVLKQVDKAMAREEVERLKQILNKELLSVNEDIKTVEGEIEHIKRAEVTVLNQNAMAREIQHRLEVIRKQKNNKVSQLKTLKVRQRITVSKLEKAEKVEAQNESGGGGSGPEGESVTERVFGGLNGQPKKESHHQRMVRLGLMTPFGTVVKTQQQGQDSTAATDFEKYLAGRGSETSTDKNKRLMSRKRPSVPSSILGSKTEKSPLIETASEPKKKRLNQFDDKDFNNYDKEVDYTAKRHERVRSYRILHNFSEDAHLSGDESQNEDDEKITGKEEDDDDDDEYIPEKKELIHLSECDSDYEEKPVSKMRKQKQQARKINAEYHDSNDEDSSQPVRLKRHLSALRERDDADEEYYLKRLRNQQVQIDEEEEDSVSDEEFDGGLVVPGQIWKKLYKYQKTGVRWLWELHCQQAGGIVGDEMGLGKTIQMIAFLAALKTSKVQSTEFRYVGLGPVIVVCPATVMHQWVREFHVWWPDFRVAILHSSGSFTGSQAQLVRSIVRSNGVLVTSYNTLVIQQELLLPHKWHYIVLDEGHKIRNPDAQATLCCKQFRTPHRIILSGSPIQNNLKELWSLFDFIFPGKLGTLPDFIAHFSVPIVQGGYSNATQVQVETAYKCACILRDTINPYLLRRMKADVKANLNLPGKSEQVLFCRLTDEQRDVYQEYLDSRECQAILAGKYKVFAGLIMLRKICNHPDIVTGGPRVLVGQDTGGDPSLEYGYWRRSGKMVVVEALLKLWQQQGHRVLLFSQSKAMLDILESFVQDRQYTYLRMDGTTSISARQPLVVQFNKTSSIYIFLLTTRVGGLGVNLTGANRIIIYDPDWNPSTDMQARERAWRIGQQRQVTIYRLLTSGTIEEKIYHRQIFKQFLTNRVLKDPKQRRFFKANDIFELFTLGSKDQNTTETSAIFAGTGSDVHMPRKLAAAPIHTPKALQKSNRFDEMRKEKERRKTNKEQKRDSNSHRSPDRKKEQLEAEYSDEDNTDIESSELTQMRELARKLSRQMEEAKRQREAAGSCGIVSQEILTSEKNQEADLGSRKKKTSDRANKDADRVSSSHRRSLIYKHSHHRKKKRKDAKCEGQVIPNLVKSCDYHPMQKSEEKELKAAENHKHQDDYVLRKLFKKTGIQGVMKHDRIMDSSRADYALVEAEATKVAKEAVAALKKSRSLCLPASSGVPTWTGTHGATAKPRFGQKKNSLLFSNSDGHPSQIRKLDLGAKKAKEETEVLFSGSQAGSVALTAKQDTLSSCDLLKRMHHRHDLSTGASTSSEDPEAVDAGCHATDRDRELLEDIRNFIAFMGDVNGQASTQELLNNFGPRLPPNESAKFKAMLLQICDFYKVNGTARWILKAEFR